MQLEFVGQSSRDARTPKASPGQLINSYSEVSDGTRVIKPVLGVTSTWATQDAVPLAAEFVKDKIYSVIGSRLHEFSPAGATPLVDLITVTEDTSISGNNGVVTVVTNGLYYTWDGANLTQISPGVFPEATDVTFFGQRTVLVEKGGRRIHWSALADPTTFSGLDFATTETRDDNNLRAVPLGGQLWIFKERSVEVWSPEFFYIPGSTIDIGLKGRNLLTERPGALAWVGTDGKIHDSDLGIISTPSVETDIDVSEPVSLAYYRDKGNGFVCLIFSDRPAWCFNLLTGEWHERSSGDDLGPWTARRLVEGWERTWAFAQAGGINELGVSDQDDGGPLQRRIASRTLEVDGRRFRVPRLEMVFNTGEGGAFLYRLSGDRGRTWGSWAQRDLGALGEYGRHVSLRRLGQFRTLNVEVALSDLSVMWATASVDIA